MADEKEIDVLRAILAELVLIRAQLAHIIRRRVGGQP